MLRGLEDACRKCPGQPVHLLVSQRKSLHLPVVLSRLSLGGPGCQGSPHTAPCAAVPLSRWTIQPEMGVWRGASSVAIEQEFHVLR